MNRTLNIKLPYSKDIIDTLKIAKEIKNKIYISAKENNTRSKKEIHFLTYNKIREEYPNFPSALIQTTRDVVIEILKNNSVNRKNINFERLSLRYDKRNIRVNLEHNLISISTISGRIKITFKDNKQISKYKDGTWHPIGATVTFNKGKLVLHLVIEKEILSSNSNQEKNILGIDRGIKNIAVLTIVSGKSHTL